jgi:glucoamylase
MHGRTRILGLAFVSLCLLLPAVVRAASGGAPGEEGGHASVWSYAGKQGVGTSYEQYVAGAYSDTAPTGPVSKVWFSIAQGIVTETAWGLIHEAQIKDLQLLVTGPGFVDEERVDTDSQVSYLHTDAAGRPLSLAYRVVNRDKQGQYIIEKHIFTDPDRQSLFVRVVVTANAPGITPYVLINPHMNNTGNNDAAYVSDSYLNAREGHDRYLSLQSSVPFAQVSAGFVGESDGWTDLRDGTMDWQYAWAEGGRGNVAMIGQLPSLSAGETRVIDLAVGFGASHASAVAEAAATLAEGYQAVLDKYNGVGTHVGWEDYLAGLSGLPAMRPMTGDGGALLQASALALKAHEDKTYAGALIASLSIPWGDTVSAEYFNTGYRAVWVRDFYQVATAFLALGDTDTALAAFRYLERLQVKPDTPGNHPDGASGWFLQKTHVDGTQEWYQVQMDQTAMPIMLAWNLWQAGALSEGELAGWYASMLKPAAEFLAHGGLVHFRGDTYTITPPASKQERWEEQQGLSPSTTAAEIAGLICAADIARRVAGDPLAASFYESRADEFERDLEASMFTRSGVYGDHEYFLRVTQNADPNDGAAIEAKNGQPAYNEKEVVDAGFLELVRYGVRYPTHASILDSLEELDEARSDDSRLQYTFSMGGNSYPGWRRYAKGDGYGERTGDGSNFRGNHGENRGRVWPIFTGERGHYELERVKAGNDGSITDAQIATLRDVYVGAMEHFADDGLMLPEQIWDGVGSNATHGYTVGEGTDSATPLAWAHAEYIKLVRSLADRNTWNSYPIVRDRYWSPHGFESTFGSVYLRGTHNGWGTQAMALVADHSWQVDAGFGGGPSERFKFDVDGQNWAHNYGDNEPNGIADRNGADIPITQGTGDYVITLRDDTLAYSVARQGAGIPSTYANVYFRGTPNGWDKNAMSLVADYTWTITVGFGGGSNERFKLDVAGDWSANYGDNDTPPDGVGDSFGADIPITQGAGSYVITFNDQSKAYTVTKQ